MKNYPIPFLVADRPISLSIIKGISLPPGSIVGILTQAATTTSQFKKLYRDYPFATDVIYHNGEPSDESIKERTIKMVDSGIFGKNGCRLSYDDLFTEYNKMKAHYGIMIDVFRNAKATIDSAKIAMKKYRQSNWNFKLVGVAQGNDVDDYFRCYEFLQKLGFEYIAIGGLLQKRANTARYVNVRCKALLESVLRGIRQRFDPKWLFPLGAFHPDRLELFTDVRVWGSDYKGWIFNYEKKDNVIELIQSGKIRQRSRISLKNLRIEEVQELSEQKLRFKLTRASIEKRVMEKMYGRRLLLIGCSNRKSKIDRRVAAWELYDGVVFRTLKKLQADGYLDGNVDIRILSAQYGIISPSTEIVTYNRQMTSTRAKQLSDHSAAILRELLTIVHYQEVMICMGQSYIEALSPFGKWCTGDVNIRCIEGRIGKKLQRLKHWVTQKPYKADA